MSTVYYDLSGGDFLQDWTDTSLITVNNNWANVPSIVGYRGDGLSSPPGGDPRLVTADSSVVNVLANQTTPNTNTTGAVAEFHLTDPTVALQGSGTAQAPSLVLYLNATGRKNLHLDLDLRDIDGSGDNAAQQIVVQYRVGESGPWVNVPGGYVADASTGPAQATQVTHLSLDLPAAVNGQDKVQVRVMTTDAAGSDEWIGVDNIRVHSEAAGVVVPVPSVSVSDVTLIEGDGGTVDAVFTLTRTGGTGPFSVDFATANGTAQAGSDYGETHGTLSFADGQTTATVTVHVNGDTTFEPNETFFLNLTNPTGGATVSDAQGQGTITNDDSAPSAIAISDVTLVEGDDGTTNAVFTVTRTGGTAAFSVDFATANGTAQAGSDYGETHGTLSFAGGQTTATVTVAVNGDHGFEPNETFFVNLSNATNGVAIADGQGKGTITNDEPAVNGIVWINEFHYDNSGTADVGEFVEVAARAGTDLSGYSLVLYNGNGGASYGTLALSGVVADQGGGFGTISVPAAGLQNGSPDGIALVGPGGVIEFISYEGTFTAANGPAAGLTSTDVGVEEDNPVPGAGGSIERVGEGLEGSEFHWVRTSDDSPGQLNAGQTFPAFTPRVHVSDVTVTEGDGGTKLLTFTVTRAGALDPFQVSYGTADGTAKAGSDYTAVSGVLDFAQGEKSKTVQVTVSGDADFERNETFTLNLSNATGSAVIVDGHAIATIANDDVAHLRVFEIQGAGHTSEYVGQHVVTEGIVTATDTTGFWIQDATGDGDDRTSDGVFVFTGGTVTVHAGDKVSVDGTVDEYAGADPNNLTVTEVTTGAAGVTVLGSGFSVAPTIIGAGGRLPPTQAIGDDDDGVFDPAHQGMDFYESIEGMLVTLKDAQATDASFGNSTWVVVDNGAEASGLNSRGGVTIADGDMNPERIQLFFDGGVSGVHGSYVAGDHLGDVTGVVTYFGGEYEVIPTAVGSTASTGTLPRETTSLHGDADQLTIGAYNVENLDPNDPAEKFAQLGRDIAQNAGGPDILGLEEVQDSDGAGTGSDFSGAVTVQKLIDAIVAAGGPHYRFIEVVPTGPTGGEPNGHIHQVILYNPDRVSYVDGSAKVLPDTNPANGDAFTNSRMPLVADFTFHGETVTVVDIHNYSRGGSQELFGANQPADNSGDQRRTDQTAVVKDYVEQLVASNPNAHVAVMGDFNGFQFETAQTQLESGGALENLTNLLAPEDRFSFSFGGNMEQIDHLYVSPSLQTGAEFDIVHLNTGQSTRPTDHDPIVARVLINTAPVGAGESYGATEDVKLVVDAAHGVAANDTDANHDALTVVLQQGPSHGTVALNADGAFEYKAAANYNGADSFTYLVRDPTGAVSAVQTVNLQVAAVNDAPIAVADEASVLENQTVTFDVLGNDTDADAGDTKTLVSVSATALGGHVSIVGGKVVYVADADSFDLLRSGDHVTDSFTYTMRDAAGLTSTATVQVTVNGVADAPSQFAGNGDNTLTGTAGEEVMAGANGNDRLYGLDGADSLSGNNGNDTLSGGQGIDRLSGDNGDDSLSGGAGADSLLGGSGSDTLSGGGGADLLVGGDGGDRFVFSGAFGRDVVADFGHGDRIQLDHLQFQDFADVLRHAHQQGQDVVIELDADDAIVLAGVSLSGLRASDFVFA